MRSLSLLSFLLCLAPSANLAAQAAPAPAASGNTPTQAPPPPPPPAAPAAPARGAAASAPATPTPATPHASPASGGPAAAVPSAAAPTAPASAPAVTLPAAVGEAPAAPSSAPSASEPAAAAPVVPPPPPPPPARSSDSAPQPSAAGAPARGAAARPSFLDPHPSGAIPSIYGHDDRRHTGFSLRLGAGAGYGWARRSLPRGSTRVHGLDGMLSLDAGAAAQENLIIYGRFAGFGWNQLGGGGSDNAGSAYAAMLGAGARYYLMPWNVYGSATAALALLKITNDLGKPQNAHPGLGLDLEVGHDFWAGTPLDRRSVGVALRFNWVHCGAAHTGIPDPKPWNAFALSFVFSVGYN